MEIMFIRKLLVGAIASTIACSSFAEDSGFSYTSIGYQTSITLAAWRQLTWPVLSL